MGGGWLRKKSDIVFLNNKVNAVMYRNILADVKSQFPQMFRTDKEGFIFQQDLYILQTMI